MGSGRVKAGRGILEQSGESRTDITIKDRDVYISYVCVCT